MFTRSAYLFTFLILAGTFSQASEPSNQLVCRFSDGIHFCRTEIELQITQAGPQTRTILVHKTAPGCLDFLEKSLDTQLISLERLGTGASSNVYGSPSSPVLLLEDSHSFSVLSTTPNHPLAQGEEMLYEQFNFSKALCQGTE